MSSLLKAGVNVNLGDNDLNGSNSGLGASPLHTAASKAGFKQGYVHLIQLLIDNGANVHSFDNEYTTPLHQLVKNYKPANEGDEQLNYFKAAELLIKNHASVNVKDSNGKTPLQLAKDAGHSELVLLFESDQNND